MGPIKRCLWPFPLEVATSEPHDPSGESGESEKDEQQPDDPVTDSLRFGYTPEQWQFAVDTGVKVLIDLASGGPENSIEYNELCRSIYVHSGIEIVPGEYALRILLRDISRVTLASHGMAITALVTYQGSTDAGKGIYSLGVDEGLLPKNATWEQQEQFRWEHRERHGRLGSHLAASRESVTGDSGKPETGMPA
jgi:hypothetical protein